MESKKILVVEDDKILSKVIKKKLESSDYQVEIVETGIQALEWLDQNENNVDMVWVDHYLPGDIDGLQLVSAIKTNPDRSPLPVFVVSNSDNKERYYTYISLGSVKYYTKAETSLDQIVDDINAMLNSEGSESEKEQK